MRFPIFNRFLPLVTGIGLISLLACTNNSKTPKEIRGYEPVYASPSSLKNIYASDPLPMQNAGKIYRYGQFIFQIDEGKGIHVIDATQRNAPLKIAFIHVPGCSEVSIRQNKLYTNNYRDLVSLDLNAGQDYKVLHRLENIFPAVSQEFPPANNVWFECPDANKGTIIAWKEKTIQNPKCKRP